MSVTTKCDPVYDTRLAIDPPVKSELSCACSVASARASGDMVTTLRLLIEGFEFAFQLSVYLGCIKSPLFDMTLDALKIYQTFDGKFETIN